MRGNPIKEWIIFSILWMILLIPVIKLTGSREQPVNATEQDSEVHSVQASATIRYTGRPLFFSISQGEKMVYESRQPQLNETRCKLPIEIEEGFAELYVQAEWPDNEEHVFEIELIIENAQERKVHCWAQRKLDDIVSFEW